MELEVFMTPECLCEQAAVWRTFIDDMDDRKKYGKLEKAITDHIWNLAGDA